MNTYIHFIAFSVVFVFNGMFAMEKQLLIENGDDQRYDSFVTIELDDSLSKTLKDHISKNDKDKVGNLLRQQQDPGMLALLCQKGLKAIEIKKTPELLDTGTAPLINRIGFPLFGFFSAASTVSEMHDFMNSEYTYYDYTKLIMSFPGLFLFFPYSLYWLCKESVKAERESIEEHNCKQQAIRALIQEFQSRDSSIN